MQLKMHTYFLLLRRPHTWHYDANARNVCIYVNSENKLVPYTNVVLATVAGTFFPFTFRFLRIVRLGFYTFTVDVDKNLDLEPAGSRAAVRVSAAINN